MPWIRSILDHRWIIALVISKFSLLHLIRLGPRRLEWRSFHKLARQERMVGRRLVAQQIRCPSLQSTRGFTLLRLLVTLSIAGILLAAASPSIETATRVYSVRSAARQVYSELQNARMAAVMGNQSYTFTINNDGKSYIVQPASGSAVTTSLETGNATISAPNAITFASNGTATTTAIVSVSGSTGGAMQVAVSTAGRIRIQ
jgi:prepilin-type N-terminal cleavage/methylation domain-containing protein